MSKRFSRPRHESARWMLKCLTDIWTDLQFGVVTWDKLSTKSYSKRCRVAKFKKDLIRDIVNSPQMPTIQDAVELYRDIRDPNRERKRRNYTSRTDKGVLPLANDSIDDGTIPYIPGKAPEIDMRVFDMPKPTVFTPVFGTEYDPAEVAFTSKPTIPDNVRRFRELTSHMANTYERKNADYGNSFTESINEFGAVAGVVRIGDKFNRLKNLVRNPEAAQVNDESITDTLLDMANYCIMLKIELENKLFPTL